ncbi:MAG: CAP domain-containing protein [Polyangiaceae bacterium]
MKARTTTSRGGSPYVLVAFLMLGCSANRGDTSGDFNSSETGNGGTADSSDADGGGSGGESGDGATGGSSGASTTSPGSGSDGGSHTGSDSGSTSHSGPSDSGGSDGKATASSCPAAPSGAPANALTAWQLVNQTRVAAGAGCMNLVTDLVTSAQAYCTYEATNAADAMCVAEAHTEVMGCRGFTGADVQTREVAAGYPQALAYTEVATTYGNDPTAAVPSWINTVFHRIPLLDPWTVDMGYGGAAGCDAIDIGRGMSTVPTSTVVVFPYDGQTNVPPSWSGLEGPEPPAPSGGFPSSYPINIYAQNLSVTQHVLTKEGDSTPIDHLWLDQNSSQLASGLQGYFYDTAFMYGAPFASDTTYHVQIVGTYSGGTLNEQWSFTTGSTPAE